MVNTGIKTENSADGLEMATHSEQHQAPQVAELKCGSSSNTSTAPHTSPNLSQSQAGPQASRYGAHSRIVLSKEQEIKSPVGLHWIACWQQQE